MRTARIRILAGLLALTGVAATGWLLLPSDEQPGRAIKVGTTDAATSLDPAGGYDAGSLALYSNVFQTLLTLETGGAEPVPDAAKRCAFVAADLRTYRCELRDGITFPSGRTMTAKDVKFSFERVKKINSDVGPSALLDTLTSVEAEGRIVTFHLSSPDTTFPFKVATGAGSIVDSTKYPDDALRTDNGLDGTGPYTLSSYAEGEKVVLSPNAHYKGAAKESGRPVELRYYSTPGALNSAWKSRKVDVATRQLPPKVLADLDPSDPGQHVSEATGYETRNLYLNVREGKPLYDLRVRQALAWLIDRPRLAATVYGGTVGPLYSLIPAGIIGHTTSFFDHYPRPDTGKARQLLTEAGVTLPVHFTYSYAEGRGAAAEEAAEIKREFEAGGLFRVKLKGYDWAEFQKRWADGTLDAYAVGWVADYPDPDTFGSQLIGTGGTMNTGYSSKTVDQMIAVSQRYADRAKADGTLTELQEAIARDVPVIPLWQAKEYVVTSEDVGGGQYLSDGTGAFRLWRLTWL